MPGIAASRKQMFEPRHIKLAWERLHQAGWGGQEEVITTSEL